MNYNRFPGKPSESRSYVSDTDLRSHQRINVNVVNVTPSIMYFDDDTYAPPHGLVVSAGWDEEVVSNTDGILIIRPKPFAKPDMLEELERIKTNKPNALILGSMLAAQAYPGLVLSPITVSKGGRDKIHSSSKFSIFPNEYFQVEGATIVELQEVCDRFNSGRPTGLHLSVDGNEYAVRGLKFVSK